MAIWTLYIIITQSGKLYTGITLDLKRRLEQHKKLSGAKFFRMDKPRYVVYTESLRTRSEALKREFQIKKMKKPEKIKLIFFQE